ncbi:MAG: flagellar hook-associated protein FlgL, partial [Planctomycetota bacterium]
MTSFPIASRVTDSILSSNLLRNIQRNLRGIGDLQRSIASGERYARPSDAPLAVRRIIAWERWVERNEKFESNIQLANSRLAATESGLSELGEIIIRARVLALQQINASANDETRSLAAVEVSALVNEAVTLGNRQFGDRYLFAGSRVDTQPFERVGNYVAYRGDDDPSIVEIAPGMRFADAVTGVQAFGGWSSEIRGRVDLDPILTTVTPLSTLNNGRGVRSGSIEIRDGLGETQTIDLSSAKTLGDVIDLINNDGFATAAINSSSDGVTLSKAGADLSVFEVNGGHTAGDLGLAKTNMGASLVGDDLDPVLTRITPIAQFLSGAGVSGAGFTI